MVKTVGFFYEKLVRQKNAHELSPVTMSRLEVIWRKSIAPFWEKVTVDKIDNDLVIEFMNWHKKNRPNVQFVNVFKYLGNIFNLMVESGDMPVAKKPKLELPNSEIKHHMRQKGRYITDTEFNAIKKKTSGWFSLFILIAHQVGMRKMEIGKMEVSRMTKKGKVWILSLDTENTKTGRARKVPLPKFLTPLIEKQLKTSKQYLFQPRGSTSHVAASYIDRKWLQAKRAAKIQGKMRFHDLRHTCASNLAKKDINPTIAVTFLGMSLATYQKSYLKLEPEDLMKASESAAGRISK